MQVRWLGHACFLLTYADGTKVVTDPFGEIGYPAPAVSASVVTVSHEHFDHNATALVAGEPQVVRGTGRQRVAGLQFTGIPSFHDQAGGKQRGENTIFVIEGDGLRLCHLGDLGHPLSADQVAAIGRVDILLLPVGGHYTIDADQAAATAEQLQPGIIIPMHYKTEAIAFPIETVDRFLRRYARVEYPDSTRVELGTPDLGDEPRIIVLNYQ